MTMWSFGQFGKHCKAAKGQAKVATELVVVSEGQGTSQGNGMKHWLSHPIRRVAAARLWHWLLVHVHRMVSA